MTLIIIAGYLQNAGQSQSSDVDDVLFRYIISRSLHLERLSELIPFPSNYHPSSQSDSTLNLDHFVNSKESGKVSYRACCYSTVSRRECTVKNALLTNTHCPGVSKWRS